MTRQGFVAMQPRDWFGVAIRLIGFALVIYGFYDLFYLAMHITGIDVPYRDEYPIMLMRYELIRNSGGVGNDSVEGGVILLARR